MKKTDEGFQWSALIGDLLWIPVAIAVGYAIGLDEGSIDPAVIKSGGVAAFAAATYMAARIGVKQLLKLGVLSIPGWVRNLLGVVAIVVAAMTVAGCVMERGPDGEVRIRPDSSAMADVRVFAAEAYDWGVMIGWIDPPKTEEEEDTVLDRLIDITLDRMDEGKDITIRDVLETLRNKTAG